MVLTATFRLESSKLVEPRSCPQRTASARTSLESEEHSLTTDRVSGLVGPSSVVSLDDAIAVYFRDVFQQWCRDDQLVTQRRTQETLTRINGIIREIIRDLSDATVRKSSERF